MAVPKLCWFSGGFARPVRFRKKSVAFISRFCQKSKTLPCRPFVPLRSVVLIIAELRPNSAPNVDR